MNSEPEGARVYLYGNPIGRTPMVFLANSNRPSLFEFRLDGYQSQGVSVGNTVGAGWVILDILLPPFWLWAVVDAVTGAWLYLDHDHLNVFMEKLLPGQTPWPEGPVPSRSDS